MQSISILVLLASIFSTLAFAPLGPTSRVIKVAPSKPGSSFRDKALPTSVLHDSTLVEASYNLAAGSATIGLVCGFLEDAKGRLAKLWGAGAIIFTLFGGFVAYQTTTLSFKFDEDSFSLVKTADGTSLGENVVVGGENDWKYSSFVNWDYYPSKDLPILVYFKETQTPIDARVEAPDIVVDNLDGQAHYFPAIARSDKLTELFTKYNCKKP